MRDAIIPCPQPVSDLLSLYVLLYSVFPRQLVDLVSARGLTCVGLNTDAKQSSR